MKMYFPTLRITFLTIKNFWDFPICGYRNALKLCSGCLSEQYMYFLVPSLTRKIRTSHSILTEDYNVSEYRKPNEKRGNKKKHKSIKVSVINENDVGTYMYLEDAEKYAQRNNLTLVELSTSTKEKPRYKLQRVSGVFETPNTTKVQSKKIKQILLREGISKNDLLTKTNQMLKFLEKEFKVICVIESKENARLGNIINEINTNGLQAYSFQKIQTVRGVKLTYEPKCINEGKN